MALNKNAITFVHLWPVEVSIFKEYEFNQWMFGQIFAAEVNNLSYKFRLICAPQGGKSFIGKEFRDTNCVALEYVDGTHKNLTFLSMKIFVQPNLAEPRKNEREFTAPSYHQQLSAGGIGWEIGDFLPQDIQTLAASGLLSQNNTVLKLGVAITMEKSLFDARSLLPEIPVPSSNNKVAFKLFDGMKKP